MRIAPGLTVVVVAIAIGCGGSSHGAEPEPASTATTGSLTVDWTVAGSSDPSACASSQATAVEVTVLNAANQPVGRFQESCSAFATNIVLQQGIYSGDARLLDATGTPLTRAMAIDTFTMHVKSQFTVPIDFPASAFIRPQ